MNLIRNFENRVSEAFGSAPQGYTAPFSFKRLARQAAKQMEAETFVIDGVDTAPALYTVLVSGTDDVAMRPLYPRITQEVVGLVKAQARAKNYVFVGEPLARFLVDPKLRSGKFAVFAENVDAATLERLRAEEAAFLSGASAVGGAAADRRAARTRKPTRRPIRTARPAAKEPQQLDDQAQSLLNKLFTIGYLLHAARLACAKLLRRGRRHGAADGLHCHCLCHVIKSFASCAAAGSAVWFAASESGIAASSALFILTRAIPLNALSIAESGNFGRATPSM